MLEYLSEAINLSDYFTISLERGEFGVSGAVTAIVDKHEASANFYATDIYDFFCQVSMIFDQYTNYERFKKEYYSLITIDKMEIVNDGRCYAASKAKRLVYKERYDTHPNLESYFNELQNQITLPQDYMKPIEKLDEETYMSL